MTDSVDDEQGYAEKEAEYQARNGRREALQFALAFETKTNISDRVELIRTADAIEAYLNDGTVPDGFHE